MVELGKKYKDKITQFEGICTGYVKYISGCNQALLVPKVLKDGSLPEPVWFDEQRLKKISDVKIKLDNSKSPGFDKQAPIR
jgi:hypothetical protein